MTYSNKRTNEQLPPLAQALFSQGLMEREGREGKGNVAKQCESKGEKCLNNKISKPLALPTDIPTINTKRVA